MKKLCFIDYDEEAKQGGKDWNYHSHPIKASDDSGHIPVITSLSWGGERCDTLGHFYKTYSNQQMPTLWYWTLRSFDYGGRERESNKRYESKREAIISLRKALNRKGYRLVP